MFFRSLSELQKRSELSSVEILVPRIGVLMFVGKVRYGTFDTRVKYLHDT